MYDCSRWRKCAKLHLDANPLCMPCLKRGIETIANTVHHNPPHNGVYENFWDSSTFESVCPSCHSGVKRIEDHYGYSQSADIDGMPIDPGHPWNKKK